MKAGGMFCGITGHAGLMLLEQWVALCIENCAKCELVLVLTIQYKCCVPHERLNISIL